MKTKPIILASAAILMAVFFLLRCKSSKLSVTDDGIAQFLEGFKRNIENGNKDSVMLCFSSSRENPGLEKLVKILISKKGTNGTALGIDVNVKDALLLPAATAGTNAKIPVLLTYNDLVAQPTNLTFKIIKTGNSQYKIAEVDGRLFFTQLIAYQNYIRGNTLSDEDIYSPITLKAFATALELKTNYDTVLWFGHIKQQTYFYVAKGKWDVYRSLDEHLKSYQMGLVGPDKKEIIPAEYDLIHNVGDAFENMVEVEKDGKKGFYDLTGNVIVPVDYDNIFLVNDEDNRAALKRGDDFYWLKKDFTISEKADVKLADVLSKLKQGRSFSISNFGTVDNITEFNSREMHGSIYIPPSYLVDMKLMPAIKSFRNPTRRKVEFFDATTNYIVKEDAGRSQTENWFTVAFYSIRDYFLGGRAEFYDKKNIIIVDNRSNKILATDLITSNEEMDDGYIDAACDVNGIKAINDSLFEVKTGGSYYTELYDTTKLIKGGTFYHYLAVRGNKLVELPNKRTFGFTKYIEMDDNYLMGCYLLMSIKNKKTENITKKIEYLTPEILKYMKNEIYADYKYQFKDKRWKQVFANITGDYEFDFGEKAQVNADVTDSLTVIDSYNISFIDKKLKALKQPTTLAAK